VLAKPLTFADLAARIAALVEPPQDGNREHAIWW
jgi:hypothetical protein